MALPPFEYTPPKSTPWIGGLLTVANVVDVPPPLRFLNGTKVRRDNDMSLWPYLYAPVGNLCAPATPAPIGPGIPPLGDHVYPAYEITQAVECDPTITATELEATANQALSINKPSIIDSLFVQSVQGFLTPGNEFTPVGSIEEVLALADRQASASVNPNQTGVRVVHLNAMYATYLLGKGVIVKSGAIYRTALGNPVSFGRYLPSTPVAFVTPMVTVLQSAATVRTVLDHQRNDHYTEASQFVALVLDGAPSVQAYTFPNPYPAVTP